MKLHLTPPTTSSPPVALVVSLLSLQLKKAPTFPSMPAMQQLSKPWKPNSPPKGIKSFGHAHDVAAPIATALGEVARAKCMSDIAEATGLTREGLYKTLSKNGNPSFSSILKVMKALGIKLKPEAA
jgi:probable addiction module antidote protein